MIPSIEEILAGLLSGQYTKEQCTGWLYTHMDLARQDGDMDALRDEFAGKAMQALINPKGEDFDRLTEVPEYAYQIADAMLAAREAA